MKLSAKKRGQIYDLVHEIISNRRRDIQRDYMPPAFSQDLKNKIDYQIAQVEIPLANKIIKLIRTII